jgi:hypothetical protein
VSLRLSRSSFLIGSFPIAPILGHFGRGLLSFHPYHRERFSFLFGYHRECFSFLFGSFPIALKTVAHFERGFLSFHPYHRAASAVTSPR